MSDAMLDSEMHNDNYEESGLLSLYLKEINRIPLLTQEEEYNLAVRAKQGDEIARKKLIEANLRFVVNVAKKYQNQGIPLNDLIDEGNIGLMTAVEKFEPSMGYHFISYAVWWIRQSIVKALCEKSRAVRLPLNRTNELMQIKKAQKNLMHEYGREANTAEIGEMTGLDPDLVKNLLSISRDMVSLDSPMTNGGKGSQSTFGDFVEDDSPSPEDRLMESSLKEDIQKVLGTLTDKERDVIELRFGLNGRAPMSLKEIGELYSLTKERIRQIEKKALEKLQNPARSRMLESYTA
ncbi:MAG: RNA polymerase sigma factor RpoD/SigA [Sphaerochaeta sp.]|jgi:RNA polymerase primary sigma factor|nr:RNA polymerase sigma factor RpoD/SigA [Sphaerochaeta sp.]